MAIAATDIEIRYSGGATNGDANLSLGGAMSSVAVVDNALQNVFDDVQPAEATAGKIEYRCLYVFNKHATLSWAAVLAWLSANTPSPNTLVEIGVGSAAAGTNEQSVAVENTAPAGVTFSSAATTDSAANLGTIPANSRKAFWLKRTTTAGAPERDPDPFTIQVEGES